MWEETGVWGCQHHCVCVCAEKGGGAYTLVRHKNYACPLVCLACCCAFVREVNICGNVLIFGGLILMPATHQFLIFQILNEKLNSKIQPEDRINHFFSSKQVRPPPPNPRVKMGLDPIRQPVGVEFLPSKPLHPPPPKGSTLG